MLFMLKGFPFLKDLGIKSGDRTILNAVHEGAYDRWSADKSLQAICQLDSYEEVKKKE